MFVWTRWYADGNVCVDAMVCGRSARETKGKKKGRVALSGMALGDMDNRALVTVVLCSPDQVRGIENSILKGILEPQTSKRKLKGNNQRVKSSRHFFTLFWHFSTHFPLTPDRGPNLHFLEKRVSGSKTSISPHSGKGSFLSKNPLFSTRKHIENGDFRNRNLTIPRLPRLHT